MPAIPFQLALLILFISMCSIAGSQLLIKSRFNALGERVTEASSLLDLVFLAIRDLGLWGGAILMGIGVLSWYTAMTKLPVTLMFPVAALVTPMVVLGAYLFLKEPLSLAQLVTILFITLGVVVLGMLQ